MPPTATAKAVAIKRFSDEDTFNSSASLENNDDDQFFPRLLVKKRKNSKTKKSPSKLQKPRRLTAVSKMYDLDGDGVLDEVEQAMRDRDKSGRGYLTNEEIYQIVREELDAKRDAHFMRKAIAGLLCFVFILALSNLGTSFAAAFLARETTADSEAGAVRIVETGDIASVQTAGDVYDVDEMTEEERRERRAMVLRDLERDPHSHTHRRLKKKNYKCDPDVDTLCDGHIIFDSNVMPEEQFSVIEQKCTQGRNVKIRRRLDATTKTDCICSSSTSVVVKKKNAIGVAKKGTRKNQNTDREVLIINEGETMNVDCVSGNCYCSGTILLGKLGDPCDLKFDSDDCVDGLVCLASANKGRMTRDRYGFCSQPQDDDVDQKVVLDVDSIVDTVELPKKKQRFGDPCDISLGENACVSGYYCRPDKKKSPVGVCAATLTAVRGAILEFQSRGAACDVALGANACIAGYYCLDNGGKALRTGTGTCVMARNVVRFQYEGQLCDVTLGDDACIAGYRCEDAAGVVGVGIGVCAADVRVAVPPAADWYIDWEIHKCVRDCAKGAAPNCGGMRPQWNNNVHATAEGCCETHLSYLRFQECVPDWPVL